MIQSPWRFKYLRSVLACASSVALFLAAFSLTAQPVPKLSSISPEWIQRGTTQEVVLTGENLGAITEFIFSGDTGLSASNVPPASPPPPSIVIESSGGGITRADSAPKRDNKRVVARVIADSKATLGARELRVVTPDGASNPLTLNVGHLPEAAENGSNNSVAQAQSISLPAALNGAISAGAQVDHFKFKAKKGDDLVFEVDAARRGSPLDSSLAILDGSGKEVVRNEDANGLDSLLFFRVAEDGEYVLTIRDFRYSGGANFNYRCYAGALPYVQSLFPFGGQRGKQVEVALTGRNLEGNNKLVLNIDAKSPTGRQEIRANTPKGLSNLVPFDVSDFPDFVESETNNTPETANSVSIPVAINGKIGMAKDVDRFRFKSDKDQKLTCEVAAYRYGSPLDALLVLTDSKGTVLQQNDDASAADARIEFDAKKDTEYGIAIRDLTGRGGEQFGYRLMIRPPSSSESGFQVRFSPDAPRLNRGSHTRIRCEITRLGGFDGPIRLEWENLPTGVSGEPLVVTTSPASGMMTLSASKDAALGTTPIRLVATASIASKSVRRTAEPLSNDKAVKQSFLTVLDVAPFTVEPVTLTATVEQNQAARFDVMVQRSEGFAGEVKLSAEGFSAGKEPITKSFDVREATVKGNESLGNVKLTARLDAEVGTRTVVFKGESTIGGAPVVQFSRPVPITVTEVPFAISTTLTRLSVTALPASAQSAASEAATIVKLQRRAGFTNEVDLALEGLPAGIVPTIENIAANGVETTLKLVATEKAPVGTNSVTIVAAGAHNDRNYKHRSGITLTVNLPEGAEMPLVATNSVQTTLGPVK